MRINHFPHRAGGLPVEPDVVERALEKWFGRHVVLMESGRAGIRAWMQAKELHRHRDKVLVPPYMSSCVLDTLGLAAFPVLDVPASMMLLYHQYGLEQVPCRRFGLVLEDIAHGIFIQPSYDAVFSLSKFFGITGTAGGIVTHDEGLASHIRKTRDNASAAATSADLAGVPIDGIADIRKRRMRVVDHLNAMTGSRIDKAPFAFPYFGEDLEAKDRALSEAGIDAGIYHVDINRDMTNPDHRRCILLPCHQDVTDDHLQTMERKLNWDEHVQ